MAPANGNANGHATDGSAHSRESPKSVLSSISSAIKASISPLPKYPYEPGNSDEVISTGLRHDIHELGFQDYQTLLLFLNTSVSGVDDDNKLLLERLVQVLSKLPPTSKPMRTLTDGFVNQLWNVLDHPPQASLGHTFKYRSADGSYNNVNVPSLGAAGTPYARTVKPLIFENPSLPDPGLVFDTLMARGDTFEPHPCGISSMLFYLASIIIHDIFGTSRTDFNINTTSSYLDLAPLYGKNAEEQKMTRTFKDGMIKPDSFASSRVHILAPGVAVFLIMFNRFHNYVVTQLALINEKNRFKKPAADADKAAWITYDEDLFQTGRLVTCGMYVNIILKDYVRTILALNRTSSTWDLDPRAKESNNMFMKSTPEGVGNQVSAEFNLLYRWHSTISPRDEKWAIDEYNKMLDGKDPQTATRQDLLIAMSRTEKALGKDPGARTFAGLKRLPDGTYDDEDLVKLLKESIEDHAGSFGANKIPRVMKVIETLGIMQSRQWNLATLNEFREFMGLTKHETFEDINPDPVVALKLAQLYDSPDAVELYPGMVSEKTKAPMTPGSGLCGTVSITRAILSDAVGLIRGDRFYTTDFTPKNLTNWGYNEVNYDVAINGGHVMHKLIFRAFPKHFNNNSIYAHYPFVTPSENKKILDSLGTSGKYSWDVPRRQGELMMIKSYKACKQILDNQIDFKVTNGPTIEWLTAKNDGTVLAKNFCLADDEAPNLANHEHIYKCMYPAGWEKDITNFFAITTNRLLRKYSYPISTFDHGSKAREIDIVRDVIALGTTHFSAALWSMPIKTEATPHGIYTEQQLYQVLMAIFASIFFDADISGSFKLHSTARELTQQLGGTMLAHAKVSQSSIVGAVIDTLKDSAFMIGDLYNKFVGAEYPEAKPTVIRKEEWPALKLFGDRMIQRMVQEKGWTLDECVWGSILPTSAAGCANQTGVLAQAVEYYIGDGKTHLPTLYALAHEGTKQADDKLMKYMLEGIRLRGTVAIYRDLEKPQVIKDYAPCIPNPADPSGLKPLSNPNPAASSYTLKLPAGTRVLVDLASANHDASVFPDPETVRLDRPIDSYMQFGWGPHQCLGQGISNVGLAALFKQIVALKNLRRAEGPAGEIKSFGIAPWNGQVGKLRNPDIGWTGLRSYLTTDQSSYWPVPSTLKVRFDECAPAVCGGQP